MNIESYGSEMVTFTKSQISNDTYLFEKFDPILTSVRGMLTSGNIVLFSANVASFLTASKSVTFSDYNKLVAMAYPELEPVFYSGVGIYFLNDLAKLHTQILTFDLTSCDTNDTPPGLG